MTDLPTLVPTSQSLSTCLLLSFSPRLSLPLLHSSQCLSIYLPPLFPPPVAWESRLLQPSFGLLDHPGNTSARPLRTDGRTAGRSKVEADGRGGELFLLDFLPAFL
ncbi:hypothetical protein QQF64_029619 [Cirrhinus molitorella]|uniref:Uncharacterized protein n=1 Tax=Cirrhinus molitorella TaxID=172907 RepID=A0ABR3N124_9TELE